MLRDRRLARRFGRRLTSAGLFSLSLFFFVSRSSLSGRRPGSGQTSCLVSGTGRSGPASEPKPRALARAASAGLTGTQHPPASSGGLGGGFNVPGPASMPVTRGARGSRTSDFFTFVCFTRLPNEKKKEYNS